MDNKKLIRAKVGIILDHPFFATLMMRKPFIENKAIKTAQTDGRTIEYNPDYFDSLSKEEIEGVICHELLHTALLHHTRRGGRNPKKWNYACDYALNPILVDAGVTLPEGALLKDKYRDRSAEEVYKLLPDMGDDEGGGMGEVVDAPAASESELHEAEAQAKLEVAQAVQMAKQQGKLPGSLERLATEMLQPKIAWQEVLARFLTGISRNDYSFSKPNTRYLSSGFILPSLYNTEAGEIVLMVDTSGSIDEDLLNRFAGEMQDIVSNFKTPIKVLYIDAEVQGEQEIDPDDTFKLEPKGGGGTDFKPGFEWLQKQGITPKAVVYFTDGACYSYPEEPDFPVLWAQTGGYSFKPPFGEVIEID